MHMTNALKELQIYTDGACSGNPGPGGWAAILIYKGTEKELSGYSASTTNNRMELFAAIEGLRALKERCRVNLYSDSSYVINAFEKGWIEIWKNNGWRTSKKLPVENQDLWMMLINFVHDHHVQFIKVKGHADNEYNNRCDKLARDEIQKHGKGSAALGADCENAGGE